MQRLVVINNLIYLYNYTGMEQNISKMLLKAPKFTHYKVGAGTKYESILTGLTVRPANLFYAAMFKGSNFSTTLPGSSDLFAFNDPEGVKKFIASRKPEETFSFTAKGVKGVVCTRFGLGTNCSDMSDILGSNTYEMSFGEVQETLKSQKIFLTETMPKKFYQGLKKAMLLDGIVILPHCGVGRWSSKYCKNFIESVKGDPSAFGFTKDTLTEFLELSTYQIGSMVIKTEDYRIFMDGEGKIFPRKSGENDAFTLINACGIRDFHRDRDENDAKNFKIMKNTFKTSLFAANGGFIVFPAVGMGVWKGDPGIYWPAFLEAVVESGGELKTVFINPGHAPSYGTFQGCDGNELDIIMKQHVLKYQDDQVATTNLKKIRNLYNEKIDVLQLSHELKKLYPDENISLFNASDPDVTLGYHVGEYTNNCPHTSTTEEVLAIYY
jgi:hypothetical protein